jgi:hypothetical protein
MALYHFNVGQVSRGKGQSVVACAAYRSGEKLHDSYYGENPDYERKGGVIRSEILLPDHAPRRLADRETLWNEVEKIERHPKAQLAYSFDVALQNELSPEENYALAREFVLENFVAKGMIADLAFHDPDRGENGIQNPHFHVLCPIRPLNADGSWGNKQRREWVLDENGERVPDGHGDFKFNAVPTTDWGSAETLLEWRKNWSDLVNKKFDEKKISERIDHRSYEARGIELIPTIHEGPTVRSMEKKGIRTDKGSWNRLIRRLNSLLGAVRDEIAELAGGIREVVRLLREEREAERASSRERRTLYSVLSSYYDERNANAYSTKAKVSNLKHQAQAISFLQENGLSSMEDLNKKVASMYAEASEACARVKACEAEGAKIKRALVLTDRYEQNKPVHDRLCRIKGKKAADVFREEHRGELSLFYAARRELAETWPDGIPEKKILHARAEALEDERHSLFATYKRLKEEAGTAYSLKMAIEADYRRAIGEHDREKNNERRNL